MVKISEVPETSQNSSLMVKISENGDEAWDGLRLHNHNHGLQLAQFTQNKARNPSQMDTNGETMDQRSFQHSKITDLAKNGGPSMD